MPASATLPLGGEPEQGGPLLAVLILRRGVAGLGHVALRQPTVRIGREEGNDVVLPAASLSAAHAELRLRGGVWSLTDLGSINGSWSTANRCTVPSRSAPAPPSGWVRWKRSSRRRIAGRIRPAP